MWRANGNYSLDKMRDQNGHHGLEFQLGTKSINVNELEFLKAKPHLSGTNRVGTFELWHQFARESPIAGKVYSKYGGLNQISVDYIIGSSQERMPMIPEAGVSLGEIFSSLPRMRSTLSSLGMGTKLVRASIETEILDGAFTGFDIQQKILVNIHPGTPLSRSKLLENILFSAQAFEEIDIKEIGDSLSISAVFFQSRDYCSSTMSVPDSISMSAGVTYFKPFMSSLNEFGMFYVGLYIIGMLCRYYPDIWIKEIEKHSSFTYLVQTFLEIASQRMPLLALMAMEESLYISNDIGIKV